MPSDEELDEELLSLTKSEGKKRPVAAGEISDDSEDERKPAKKKQKSKPKPKTPASRRGKSQQKVESESDKEFDDGYDENLMGDEEDRRYLESLPETKREEIIAERYAKRKELEEKKALKRGMQGKSPSTPTSSSKKPYRSDGSRQSALSDLKQRRARATSTRSYSSSSESEESDEEETFVKGDDSDDEWIIKESSKKEESKVEEQESSSSRLETITQDGMNEIRLTRVFLEGKVEEPYFDELVVGFFVRVGIGMSNDKPVYRAAVIDGVKEHPTKTFTVGKKKTNKMLVLRHANFTKSFPIEVISNQIITSTEYSKWITDMQRNHMEIMTMDEVAEKKKTLEKYRNYTYTEEDVRKIVEQRKQRLAMPVNVSAERLKLITMRDAAKDNGDMEEYQKMCNLIQEFDEREEQRKKKVNDITGLINKRNKLNNIEDKKYDVIVESTVNPDLDPFSRRRTMPAKVISISGEDASTNKPAPKPTLKPQQTTKLTPASLPTDKIAEEIKKAHNIDLDISLEPLGITSKPSGSTPKIRSIVPTSQEKPKTVLSLMEYKIRRGMV